MAYRVEALQGLQKLISRDDKERAAQAITADELGSVVTAMNVARSAGEAAHLLHGIKEAKRQPPSGVEDDEDTGDKVSVVGARVGPSPCSPVLAQPKNPTTNLPSSPQTATYAQCINVGENPSDLVSAMLQAPYFALFPRSVLESFDILRRDFYPGEEIVRSGTDPTHVYVVLSGSIEVYEYKHGMHIQVGKIEVTGTFGSQSAILQRAFRKTYRASLQGETSVMLIHQRQFLDALRRTPRVAQSFSRHLCEQMSLFKVFRQFCREVFSSSRPVLNMEAIIGHYADLQSCLHPHLQSPRVDVDAWAYAINRLPVNITETFSLNLSRCLPPFLAERMRNNLLGVDIPSSTNLDTKLIPTKYRRRCAWQIGMEVGKTIVLLRDGYTDLLDFITMLCVHITESKKLRGRLQGMISPAIADLLDNALMSKHYVADPEPKALQIQLLEKLPLSNDERAGLRKIWPNTLLKRLHDVLLHREEYRVEVSSTGISKRFDSDPYQQWMLNIRAKVMEALSLGIYDSIPSNIGIHIISSNTYSTKHVLVPFVRQHAKRIHQYGCEFRADVVAQSWKYHEDMLYALLDSYVQHYGLKGEYTSSMHNHGITQLEDRAATGLAVDIICLWLLDKRSVDSVLRKSEFSTCSPDIYRDIIINMDFAFGAQADGILNALILLFGQRIKSVNVLGKAGGLRGKRGDIQLATHVLLSKSALANSDATDELRSCGNTDVSQARLEELSGRSIHKGPVLTIPGTILQNVELLRYYETLWGCVGVEMEGSYFARQVQEGLNLGLLRPGVLTRFAYNTSDLPMETSGETNLSTDLRLDELIPPLYAITRAFVELILFG